MNTEILKALFYAYPEESMLSLVEFYERFPDIQLHNFVNIFNHYKENMDYDRKKIQDRCDELNATGVYFKYKSENRIVFSKLHNFFISNENVDKINYDLEDIVIEKTKIIFHSSHQSTRPLDEEYYKNEKYSIISKEEYERVISQLKTNMELTFIKYSK